MDEDILGNLEDMMGDNTALGSAPETGRADGGDGMQSALAAISDPVTRERVLSIALDHQVDRRDPAWLLVETATVSMSAAFEAGTAARLVHEDVARIPETVQKAAISASSEVAGQIDQALHAKIPDFASAIKMGILKGTESAVTSLNSASGKLEAAASKFDNDVDKTVIARRDAVLASWVQSGSDTLEKRMATALKKERLINTYLVIFLAFSMFMVGVVLGMHLHF